MPIYETRFLCGVLQNFFHGLSAANEKKLLKFGQINMSKIKEPGAINVKMDAEHIKWEIRKPP